MKKQRGFTLLELIVTIGVVGSCGALAYQGMSNNSEDKTAINTYKELRNQLHIVKNESLMRNVTTKITITVASNVYTITTEALDSSTKTCTTAGTWTQMMSQTLDVHSNYSVTGASVTTPLCFYRDGTSSGGTYVVAPGSGSGSTYTFTISMATGYIDIVES